MPDLREPNVCAVSGSFLRATFSSLSCLCRFLSRGHLLSEPVVSYSASCASDCGFHDRGARDGVNRRSFIGSLAGAKWPSWVSGLAMVVPTGRVARGDPRYQRPFLSEGSS